MENIDWGIAFLTAGIGFAASIAFQTLLMPRKSELEQVLEYSESESDEESDGIILIESDEGEGD